MIKLIKESYGDLSDYLERYLDSWYGRLNELQSAIEDLGLDVDEINNEYVIVHAAEPDGEDVYCKIRLGGTPRTISLETFEMLESVRRSKNVLRESDDKITARSFQELISKLEDHGYSCEHYYDTKYPESNWLYITKNGDPYEAEFYRYSDGEYELYLHNIHPTKRRRESVSKEKDIIRLEHTSYDYLDRRRLAESITNLVFRTNDKNTHMNRLLKTDLKFASKMYRDRIAKCTTEEELSETLSRCSLNVLKRIKESLEESKKRCNRNKLTEKSNFDDTQKAIDYYYPKWYYDDMSVNDIYDRLEKLGHSQDFIDAVIDGITDRYENEEDCDLDDYNECLEESNVVGMGGGYPNVYLPKAAKEYLKRKGFQEVDTEIGPCFYMKFTGNDVWEIYIDEQYGGIYVVQEGYELRPTDDITTIDDYDYKDDIDAVINLGNCLSNGEDFDSCLKAFFN